MNSAKNMVPSDATEERILQFLKQNNKFRPDGSSERVTFGFNFSDPEASTNGVSRLVVDIHYDSEGRVHINLPANSKPNPLPSAPTVDASR